MARQKGSEARWSDWVAIERAVAGEPVGRRLTVAEIRAVVRRLVIEDDLSIGEAARRCGVGHSTIRHHLNRLQAADSEEEAA